MSLLVQRVCPKLGDLGPERLGPAQQRHAHSRGWRRGCLAASVRVLDNLALLERRTQNAERRTQHHAQASGGDFALRALQRSGPVRGAPHLPTGGSARWATPLSAPSEPQPPRCRLRPLPRAQSSATFPRKPSSSPYLGIKLKMSVICGRVVTECYQAKIHNVAKNK